MLRVGVVVPAKAIDEIHAVERVEKLLCTVQLLLREPLTASSQVDAV